MRTRPYSHSLARHRIPGNRPQVAALGASYPYDTISPYAGYDVAFQMKTGQTQMVEVREDGGGTYEWIGPTAAGVLDQAALTTHTGANNGFVRTAKDATGNGRDISRTIDANQPQIVVTGTVYLENSVPALKGANADRLILFDTIAQPITYFMVGNITNSQGRIIWGGDSHEIFDSGGSMFLDCGSSLNGGAGYSTKQSVISALCNGASSSLRADGSEIASGDAGSTGVASALSWGSGASGATNVVSFQHLTIFNSDQSANFAAIETAINALYGVY